MDFTAFLAGLDDKGRDYAHSCRNRLRTSYMAAKAYGKMQDWTPGNDTSFEAIDLLVTQLVNDAGYESRGKAATLSNEELVKQAIERGYSISPRASVSEFPPTDDRNKSDVNPSRKERPLVNEQTLEAALRGA